MSTEADARTMLGVYVTMKSLDQFKVTVEAVQHEEVRWDPKTGTKLPPVIVIDDPAHYVYKIRDKVRIPVDPDDLYALVWRLADELAKLAAAPECVSVRCGDDDEGFVIGRTLCTADAGSVGYSPTAAVGDACNEFDGFRDEVQKWATALQEHNVVIERSGIMTICSVG